MRTYIHVYTYVHLYMYIHIYHHVLHALWLHFPLRNLGFFVSCHFTDTQSSPDTCLLVGELFCSAAGNIIYRGNNLSHTHLACPAAVIKHAPYAQQGCRREAATPQARTMRPRKCTFAAAMRMQIFTSTAMHHVTYVSAAGPYVT